MPVMCPYCRKNAVFVDSAEVYHGKSHGKIWLCRDCQAWVGVHNGTDRPLGRLANAALRKLKMQVHAAFDPIWKTGLDKRLPLPNGVERLGERSRAYLWLAFELGIAPAQCHIGMFNDAQCLKVIEVCEKVRASCTSDS